jgi:DNA-binding response OmpR family regulator
MNKKILVVDDDADARRILVRLLKATGTVLEAATGAEALRLIEDEKPRIMLLDIIMPGMSGLQVLEASRPYGVPMTIIMLTGQKDIELAKRALGLGATEYITKPFDLADLKDKIKLCLESAPKDAKKDGAPPWRTADAAHPVKSKHAPK